MTGSVFLNAAQREAVWLSCSVASMAVLLSIIPAIALAYVLARRRFPGKSLVELTIHLGLVLPPVVVGYLLLLVLGNNGVVGRWLDAWFGISVAFTWWAAVLAAAVVGFPLMVRSMRLGFHAVDPRLEVASRSLGAGPCRTFWAITLPLAMRGIISGCLLGFARSLGEFGATILFAGNIEGETRTIPLAIYTEIQRPDGLTAAGHLALLSVLLAGAALAIGGLVEHRDPSHAPA
ncbi:Molybdenum transport system permease protein ModB [Planctomycetes bacterium Pan216]|uniref:Molybdenum transport system permease n=1 Tax=Kolteria novifilia TaxID=2527975 RepID=A0A518B4X5_9BACT|nr:Molybdenum transport system permease protein ModB [Planctomycetes bacterium Pan216]